MIDMVGFAFLVAGVTFAIGVSMIVFSLLERKALQQMMERALEVINETFEVGVARWDGEGDDDF